MMIEHQRDGLRGEVAEVNFQSVAKVAQKVHLTEIRLAWSQVGRYVEFGEVEPDWAARAFALFNSHAAVEEAEESISSPFTVQCFFVLHYFRGVDSREAKEAPEASEENPPSIAIEAMFDLIYELEDPTEIEAADLQHFAIANGTHNAWPYWRELAQQSSLRLGLAPYIAPPFKLPSRDDPASPESATDVEAGEDGEH